MIDYIKWLPSYMLVYAFFEVYAKGNIQELLIGLFCAMAAFIFRDYMERYND